MTPCCCWKAAWKSWACLSEPVSVVVGVLGLVGDAGLPTPHCPFNPVLPVGSPMLRASLVTLDQPSAFLRTASAFVTGAWMDTSANSFSSMAFMRALLATNFW